MKLIVAADPDFKIGKDGGLLTYLPEDLAFFKSNTLNKTLVLGSKTLLSFKNQKPLPKREHIVFSRNMEYEHERVVMVRNLLELKEAIATKPMDEVFVAGGGQIYKLLLPYCSEAHVTMLEDRFDGEIYMPNLFELPEWEMTQQGP